MTIKTSVATAATNTVMGPLAEKERIIALDVIRGVALLGILLMNIEGYGQPYGLNELATSGDAPTASLWAWIITNTFFEGTQRTLFSLLFGAGVILLTTRMEKKGSGLLGADIYYRRIIWLIIFGMVHAYLLLWDGGDILFPYGIAALFLFPLRTLAPKYLLAIGIAGLLIIAAQETYDSNKLVELNANYFEVQHTLISGDEPTKVQSEFIEEWTQEMEWIAPTEEVIQRRITKRTGNYWEMFIALAPDTVRAQSIGFYRWQFLDVFSVMVFGMALMKLGVMTLRRSTRFYLLMVIAGYGIGLPVSLWETTSIISGDFDLVSRVSTWPTYNLGRIANATGHLGLLLLFCRSGWLKKLQDSLAAVGRMALTNYIMHTIICGFIFWGVGFKLYGVLERYELYYVVFAIWVFQLIVSPIWLKYCKFGPLEWVWRSLTYVKRQPMRRMLPTAK